MSKTLEILDGDIFSSGCDVLVNPTNLDPGHMGALAGVFARRFPGLEERYLAELKARGPDDESPVVFADPRYKETIVNLPTCDRMGGPADVTLIYNGLRWLCDFMETRGYRSVALPALGCGVGGLDWVTCAGTVGDWFAAEVPDGVTVRLYRPRPDVDIRRAP